MERLRQLEKMMQPGIVDTRLKNLEKTLRAVVDGVKEDVERLRDELHARDIVAAADHLRLLNERQGYEGLGRFRSDLQNMRDRGIVEEKGNRVFKGFPAQVLDDTYDA